MKTLKTDPKKIFLVDGIGALVTATLLYFVVRKYAFEFGVPPSTSITLSIIAAVIAAISFNCFLFVRQNYVRLLRTVATANILYCITTAVLLSEHYDHLTNLGILYFTGESAIIIVLALIELRLAKQYAL